MTCIHIPDGILTLADESEIFKFAGKLWRFSEAIGPFRCTVHGDPIQNQPEGTILQEVYEHYMATRKA